ncbi:Uncharacterised protein (plasmid) [Tsukamurella tyrosinosolvens]|uniref:Uncharacterized protein n=1 Tax=Tsukamurella tyrosinosolvens TaxID=57704 RepID=A0A1H4VP34_TSUTY|nr:hypothetical protein [Tsukamurella tyrosinosolvens]KXO90923.1 hypothetical protein AXK58_21045 [Tsukamurella tyrosinosolvens]SEC82816.1 hypothetical protein SAMN04489793_3292 [Tsukamurella tyrosinosolvens]VEH90389.1 Uncharacterised protein [Tsukamurella tyrosinosolvens]
MKIGIQAERFTDRISAARLNKAETLLLGDKQDVTDDCILAVAAWARYHYESAAEVRYGATRIVIQVFDEEEAK